MALGRTAAEATQRYVSGPYRFHVLSGKSHWLLDEDPDVAGNLIVEHLTAGQAGGM
jgi:hypothetical protein